MKLTQWIDGDVKPVHKGIYQRKWPLRICWCKWTGKGWSFSWAMDYDDGFERAENDQNKTIEKNLPWRGLAVKP